MTAPPKGTPMQTLQDRPVAFEMPQGEAEVRRDLAACYRLMAHYGLDDTIYTHVSARIPAEPGAFLINPFGLLFCQVTPSNLVKVDAQGRSLEPANPYPANAAGFVIHSAVLGARADAFCAIHTHTRSGVAFSCLEEGLLPLNQFALEFHERVAYHGYEGIALNLEEREHIVRDLGDKAALVLRNHGLLTVGPSIPGAFYLTYYLEQAIRVQMDVLATGRPFILPPESVQRHTAGQFTSARNPMETGQRMWPAMLALLDSTYPGWDA
jgi:ribulose-5-phosphate 4-epimerase/fuculose-1-phosphate aldolase